jgi:hypothetical protein
MDATTTGTTGKLILELIPKHFKLFILWLRIGQWLGLFNIKI